MKTQSVAVSALLFRASVLVAAGDVRPTTTDKIKGAFFGSVVADALTLGTHYEYDAQKIKQFYGTIDRFYAPGEKTGGETHGVGWGNRNYHNGNGVGPAKAAGECTDYGDYNILILDFLASLQKSKKAVKRIELSDLIPFWQQKLSGWRSWLCSQTKQTYQQVSQGVAHKDLGGHSNAMAVRTAAAFAYFETEDDIIHASRAAMFTHRETTALQGGEFFARVTYKIIHENLSPRQAIEKVAQQSSTFIRDKVKQAIAKVAEATDEKKSLSKEEYVDDLALTSMARLWDVGKSEPIKVGKASPTEGTLPGSIYFILKYEGDFEAAAKANAGVGGDNASRAVAIGMVMGAAQGVQGIPPAWGAGHLTDWKRMEQQLNSLPLLVSTAAKSEL